MHQIRRTLLVFAVLCVGYSVATLFPLSGCWQVDDTAPGMCVHQWRYQMVGEAATAYIPEGPRNQILFNGRPSNSLAVPTTFNASESGKIALETRAPCDGSLVWLLDGHAAHARTGHASHHCDAATPLLSAAFPPVTASECSQLSLSLADNSNCVRLDHALRESLVHTQLLDVTMSTLPRTCVPGSSVDVTLAWALRRGCDQPISTSETFARVSVQCDSQELHFGVDARVPARWGSAGVGAAASPDGAADQEGRSLRRAVDRELDENGSHLMYLSVVARADGLEAHIQGALVRTCCDPRQKQQRDMSSSSSSSPIEAFAECTTRLDEVHGGNARGDMCRSWFGYRMADDAAHQHRPVSELNAFVVTPYDRGQPVHFVPGEHRYVFSVVWNCSDHGESGGPMLAWRLDTTATASRRGPMCAVGCDGVHGSDRQYDRCGVCGGTGNTCDHLVHARNAARREYCDGDHEREVVWTPGSADATVSETAGCMRVDFERPVRLHSLSLANVQPYCGTEVSKRSLPSECVTASDCPLDRPLCQDNACVRRLANEPTDETLSAQNEAIMNSYLGRGYLVNSANSRCDAAADCDDGHPCTLDVCVCGHCMHRVNPWCCICDAECPPALDACEVGICDMSINRCDSLRVDDPSCCSLNYPCNTDQDTACEQTLCVNNVCTQVPTDAPGCCQDPPPPPPPPETGTPTAVPTASLPPPPPPPPPPETGTPTAVPTASLPPPPPPPPPPETGTPTQLPTVSATAVPTTTNTPTQLPTMSATAVPTTTNTHTPAATNSVSAQPTPTATTSASARPTPAATTSSSAQPTPAVTASSSARPTASASAQPTPEATASSSAQPTPAATTSASAQPTPEATTSSSAQPTPEVTTSPSAQSTPAATASASAQPTPTATASASARPTSASTSSPSETPTPSRTQTPTRTPSRSSSLSGTKPSDKPGNGYGDDNKNHTGPPGQQSNTPTETRPPNVGRNLLSLDDSIGGTKHKLAYMEAVFMLRRGVGERSEPTPPPPKTPQHNSWISVYGLVSSTTPLRREQVPASADSAVAIDLGTDGVTAVELCSCATGGQIASIKYTHPGSSATVDKCGVCGGDGSSCQYAPLDTVRMQTLLGTQPLVVRPVSIDDNDAYEVCYYHARQPGDGARFEGQAVQVAFEFHESCMTLGSTSGSCDSMMPRGADEWCGMFDDAPSGTTTNGWVYSALGNAKTPALDCTGDRLLTCPSGGDGSAGYRVCRNFTLAALLQCTQRDGSDALLMRAMNDHSVEYTGAIHATEVAPVDCGRPELCERVMHRAMRKLRVRTSAGTGRVVVDFDTENVQFEAQTRGVTCSGSDESVRVLFSTRIHVPRGKAMAWLSTPHADGDAVITALGVEDPVESERMRNPCLERAGDSCTQMWMARLARPSQQVRLVAAAHMGNELLSQTPFVGHLLANVPCGLLISDISGVRTNERRLADSAVLFFATPARTNALVVGMDKPVGDGRTIYGRIVAALPSSLAASDNPHQVQLDAFHVCYAHDNAAAFVPYDPAHPYATGCMSPGQWVVTTLYQRGDVTSDGERLDARFAPAGTDAIDFEFRAMAATTRAPIYVDARWHVQWERHARTEKFVSDRLSRHRADALAAGRKVDDFGEPLSGFHMLLTPEQMKQTRHMPKEHRDRARIMLTMQTAANGGVSADSLRAFYNGTGLAARSDAVTRQYGAYNDEVWSSAGHAYYEMTCTVASFQADATWGTPFTKSGCTECPECDDYTEYPCVWPCYGYCWPYMCDGDSCDDCWHYWWLWLIPFLFVLLLLAAWSLYEPRPPRRYPNAPITLATR